MVNWGQNCQNTGDFCSKSVDGGRGVNWSKTFKLWDIFATKVLMVEGKLGPSGDLRTSNLTPFPFSSKLKYFLSHHNFTSAILHFYYIKNLVFIHFVLRIMTEKERLCPSQSSLTQCTFMMTGELT